MVFFREIGIIARHTWAVRVAIQGRMLPKTTMWREFGNLDRSPLDYLENPNEQGGLPHYFGCQRKIVMGISKLR